MQNPEIAARLLDELAEEYMDTLDRQREQCPDANKMDCLADHMIGKIQKQKRVKRRS